jgi:uncharacterized protein YndB with AHSA1/START domain
MLMRLSKVGESPVSVLSKLFDISAAPISRHLRVIEKARLIDRRRVGRLHLVQARPARLKPAEKWLTQCAAGWSFSLDALDGGDHQGTSEGGEELQPEVQIAANRLEVTRIFNAPRSLVYRWRAHAEKLQQWSGCKEAVSCRVTMDFRIGRSFTQQMRISLNGGTCQFTIRGTYERIVVPEKIVYKAHRSAISTRVTVNFFEHGDTTKVVLVHEGLPDEVSEAKVFQGTSESLDKLDCLLAGRAVVRWS